MHEAGASKRYNQANWPHFRRRPHHSRMIRIFRVFIPTGTLALLISETLLLFSSFILASYLVLAVDPTVFLLYDGGLTRFSLVVASILLALHFQDLYSRIQVKSRIMLAQQLC